ncbi:hypothetical protein V490_05187 [Pseudogymnoascus sp. VKM F-3557]|nr:hypothetical protein V490_05187 [Pseudogymnoascus sp. VKM F-3557]
MSNGKGKGPAKPAGEPEEQLIPNETTTTSSNSVLDRVAASAIGLTRSAFGTTNSNDVNDSAAAALATSGKGQGQSSSSGQGSVWAESSQSSRQQPALGAQQPGPQTFRSSHQEQHAASAEAEFSSFLDGIDTFGPSTEDGTRPVLDEDDTRSFTRAPAAQAQGHNSEPRTFRTVEEQESHDGEEVLGILSERRQEADYFAPQSIEDEIEEWRLTDDQTAKIQALVKDLFPSSDMHAARDVSDPLNLQPTTFSSNDMSTWLPDEYAQESYSHFGQVLPQEEASSLWIEQWEGVLSRYADEVWGGLLPLVREAREEIEEIKQAEDPAEHRPKALRRLGQVLAHFKS